MRTILAVEISGCTDEKTQTLVNRINAFAELAGNDIEAARALCSGENLLPSITLTVADFDARQHPLFNVNEDDMASHTVINTTITEFSQRLNEAREAIEFIKKHPVLSTMDDIIFHKVNEMKKKTDVLEVLICYLKRYYLIKEHPKVSEGETGQ